MRLILLFLCNIIFVLLAYQNINAQIKFAVIGDYGDDNANEQSVADLINSWNVDFIITTGDNSYTGRPIDENIGKYYADWIGNYIGTYGSGSTTNKFFPSLGNHDYHDGGGLNAYLDYFTLPGISGNSSGNERYYDSINERYYDSILVQSFPQYPLPQFGTITVGPDIQVNGAGQNIDTIEFWKAPDSTETLMFVTAKGNHLVEVWKYPFDGNEFSPLTHSTFNGGQVNGLAIDQEADLLYVSIGAGIGSNTVSVFSLPNLNFQMNFNKPGADYFTEPNLALLNITNGSKNIYVSADFTVYIHDAVTGNYINEFTPIKGLETMAPDSFYQRLYIPDENNKTGIYVYNPDGTAYTGNGSNVFGNGHFNADAEGIIVYNYPINDPVDIGNGFIVVSDQIPTQTDFEFFDRITWEHLGTLRINGVANTDGIASYPYPLPDYPLGVFAALDNNQSVAIVGWDKIFNEIVSPITVTSPNGGEGWQAGSQQFITWNDNIAENVMIELYKGSSFHAIISTSTGSDGSKTWDIHSGITPASDYTVKITSINDGNVTDVSDGVFSITAASPIQTKFAVIGDYGDDNANEQAVADLINSWNVDFIITTGDNSYTERPIDENIGQYYSDWIGNYNGNYGTGSPVNKFFPSLGNHDYSDGGGLNAYLNYFTLPGISGNSSGNEEYYDYIINNIHFFALNSNVADLTVQQSWLETQMLNCAQIHSHWKIVYDHHPPYSSGSHGSFSDMRWDFLQWGADAVMSGHDHSYERLEVNGLVYFVNGLGGKSIYNFGNILPESQIRYNGDYGAQLVMVNDTEMKMEFWSIGSSFNNVPQLIDSYTIPPPVLPSVVTTGAGFALDFDGSNDFVLVPDDNSLDLTSAITLEAWIKPDEVSTQYLIKKAIYNGAPSDNGYELSLSRSLSGTKFFFRLNQQESGDTYRLNSNTQYQTGIWTHIAATYDGSNMRIYINGVEDNSLYTSSPVSIYANSLALGLGAQSNGDRRLNGQLDEVRVWDIARTELQIREYMCKKLTGSETGLVGYWRFDETQGLSTIDETINSNHGTMTNMDESDHIWSGTTLGDDIAFDYDSNGGYTVSLSHSDGDNFTATTKTGTINGIQLYRVDDNAIRSGSTVPNNYTVTSLRYWGVQVIGSGNLTYDIVYNYDGHPGIVTETNLRLVKRNNISDPDWVDAGALLDVDAKTLSLTAQTDTEYALATTSDPLPVELASFKANVIDKDIHLFWQTLTEVNNYGFDIERSTINKVWSKIGFAQGHGNSNSTKYYNFTDKDIDQSSQYHYRLKQIDNDGTYKYSNEVKVSIGIPDEFYLSQNYPNPFNSVTVIKYQIPEASFVTLKVYEVLGREVSTLVNEEKSVGSFEVEFDGSYLTSGIYFYRLIAGEFNEAKSMMLMK